MLGAPRSKFKMAVSVTDFGIQCTHKAHRIIWHTADFCENLRLLGAPHGAENTVSVFRAFYVVFEECNILKKKTFIDGWRRKLIYYILYNLYH